MRELAALHPKDTDRLLAASLPSSVSLCLKPIERTWYDASGFNCELTGYRIDGEIAAADRATALALIEAVSAPLPVQEILAQLGKLRVMTKVRAEEHNDMKLTMRVYADAIMDYPADVAMQVLKTQAAMSKWWPAWEELKDRLDFFARRRRAQRAALLG